MADPTGFTPRHWWYDAMGVLRFAWSMWKKLRANRHKEHWTEYGDYIFFRGRIENELDELDLAHRAKVNLVRKVPSPKFVSECRWEMEEAADAGNFLMMIHERARLGL